MYQKNMFFTLESVTEGHPDKFCDQISDVVLDECPKQDSLSRVDNVVIAASDTDEVVTPDGKYTTGEAEQEIVDRVVQPVVGDLLDKKSIVTVNGTGKFLVSSPQSDTGLTGRKIIVDTYGRTLLKETILWRKTLS